MNNKTGFTYAPLLTALVALLLTVLPCTATAQSFDFDRIKEKARSFTVIVEASLEFSFGMQTAEQQERLIGTVVSEDGLILVDGTVFGGEQMLPAMSSFHFKTTPTRIEVKTLDGETFDAEYVGVDRFTKIGFVRVTDAGDRTFTPVTFVENAGFKIGDWVALFMMLPDFIEPPLAADVGMISALVEQPENFALTVGFSSMQVTSVLWDEQYRPVGVLGPIMDPAATGGEVSGMFDSFNQFGAPLLGVITADRLTKLIADPPQKGQIDRGWLGITLQALTKEIADFWDIEAPGGIIVNDVVANSPAEQGGLQVGDIIVAVNSAPVPVDKEENLSVFQRQISELGPGTDVNLVVLRPQKEKIDTAQVSVTLAKAPTAPSDAEDFESEMLEMKVRNMVLSDYLRHNLDSAAFEGVVVSEIKPGGLADIGGLQIGDIVQRVESVEVASVGDFQSALENLEGTTPSEIIFFVWRDQKTLFVNVKTEWD